MIPLDTPEGTPVLCTEDESETGVGRLLITYMQRDDLVLTWEDFDNQNAPRTQVCIIDRLSSPVDAVHVHLLPPGYEADFEKALGPIQTGYESCDRCGCDVSGHEWIDGSNRTTGPCQRGGCTCGGFAQAEWAEWEVEA